MPCAELAATSTLLATGEASQVAPNILSIAHWNRILGGELYAPLSRVDWATLLRRTFDVDVKACAACGGRMTVRAVVTDPAPSPSCSARYSAHAHPPSQPDSPRHPRATRRAKAEPCPTTAKTPTSVQPPWNPPESTAPDHQRSAGASRLASHRPLAWTTHLTLESGPASDPVRHARLRRVTVHYWTLECATHSGRWEKTGCRGPLPMVLGVLTSELGWVLAPVV